ncbi:protein RKD1-like, partial [Humulus lupulus]|uniref:protein RKD1-like n=1 Tax=Humulus lupulus TaxID=3486 RepID=UPI002B400F36
NSSFKFRLNINTTLANAQTKPNHEMVAIDENPFPLISTDQYFSSSDLDNFFSWEYNWQYDQYLPVVQESYLLDPVPLMEYYPTNPLYSTAGLDPIIHDEFLSNNGNIGFGIWEDFGPLGFEPNSLDEVNKEPFSVCSNIDSNYGDHGNGKDKTKKERQMFKRSYRSSVVISEEKSSGTSSSKRLSRQVLSQYYYMPITQAAKELNVGLTLLKKRCRELGISRWPHRKLMSLQTLIKNVQDLRNGESSEENDSRYKQYIELLEREKKLVEEVPNIELNDGTKRLRQACFKNNYKKRKMRSTSGSDSGLMSSKKYCSSDEMQGGAGMTNDLDDEDDEIKFLLSESFSSTDLHLAIEIS